LFDLSGLHFGLSPVVLDEAVTLGREWGETDQFHVSFALLRMAHRVFARVIPT